MSTPPPVPPYGPPAGSTPPVLRSGAMVSAPGGAGPGGYGATAPGGAGSGAASRRLGIIALTLAFVALGAGLASALAVSGPIGDALARATAPDLSALTPVRDWVLGAELAFWGGTTLGITALGLGIAAAARNRGRGFGVAAIVVAVLAPIIVGIGALVGLAATFAAAGLGGFL